MRTRTWLFSALLLSSCLFAISAQAQPMDVDGDGDADEFAEGEEVPVEAFDQPLAPYGEWIVVGGVGRVWRPYAHVVGSDFRPYSTGGRWVYSDYGWTFVSAYDWGWAPFHYGHWWHDAAYGWVWMPGSRWAPAWVDWRYGGGYVGWAPVPPPGFHFSATVSWGSPWCFVETRYISQPAVTTYVVPAERVRTVYVATQAAPVTVRGRAVYSAGPPADHVSSVTRVPVRPVSVRQMERVAPPAQVQRVRVARSPMREAVPVRPNTTAVPVDRVRGPQPTMNQPVRVERSEAQRVDVRASRPSTSWPATSPRPVEVQRPSPVVERRRDMRGNDNVRAVRVVPSAAPTAGPRAGQGGNFGGRHR